MNECRIIGKTQMILLKFTKTISVLRNTIQVFK